MLGFLYLHFQWLMTSDPPRLAETSACRCEAG